MLAFNFGRSVIPTNESIETEAIYHYSPGARIMSLGNLGCMMSCDFCQNWQTSQVKHLVDSAVTVISPEEVVSTALATGIRILSWTYNDPVVWHEFVMETAKLAQAHGIRNLYKSAFYIERAPADELLEVIDIFSISLKSLDPVFYRKVTKASLGPVLDRIVEVAAADKHLEISQLVVPQLNDRDEDIVKTIDWILEKLGSEIPLHFVAFHPAYKYREVSRTPEATLRRARELALTMGVEHCYLGNVFSPGVSDTCCTHCGALLVSRYGLSVTCHKLDNTGLCVACGKPTPIRYGVAPAPLNTESPCIEDAESIEFLWSTSIRSVHVEVVDSLPKGLHVVVQHATGFIEEFVLRGPLRRVMVSKHSPEDTGIRISWRGPGTLRVLQVLDRAHFPISPPLHEPVRAEVIGA